MDQYALGWPHEWDHHLDEHAVESLVRITARHRRTYQALSAKGRVLNCYVSGRLLREDPSGSTLPVVGDWCFVGDIFKDESNSDSVHVLKIFPRRSGISRLVAGTLDAEQTMAANVDYIFVVTSVNRDFNINRLRRFLLLAEHGGATPVIILSKCDLCEGDTSVFTSELEETLPSVPYIITSSMAKIGVDEISSRFLSPGKTAVFVGSSGVGKSTLVNALLDREEQKTSAIRETDQRGRHTTSGSELFFLPQGGIIIDTAGLREVSVVGEGSDLDAIMPEVSAIVAECKFSNCTHELEPDCAVQAAVTDGQLDEGEIEAYSKLERELAFGKSKTDKRVASEERKKWKKRSSQQSNLD